MKIENAERLFEFMDSRHGKCSKCESKLVCVAVRFGFYKDIIGLYSCKCRGNDRSKVIYSGLNADEKEEFKKIIGEETFGEIEKNQSGAIFAEIKCPLCGAKEKFRETEIRRGGKVLHRYDCRNGFCKDFEKSLWIEILESDLEKIFKKANEAGKCRICGKLRGAKIYCRKEKGLLCEEHCLACEYRYESGGGFGCRFK